jgi:hypothetical protein
LATWVSGISDSGDIVGYYNDGTTFHGFLLSKGKFTVIQPPASDGDLARGINARGDIVGQFGQADVPHCFLYRKGTYIIVDPPGSSCCEQANAYSIGACDQRRDLEPVVHRVTQILLAAQIALRGLDGDMAEQELNLFQFAAEALCGGAWFCGSFGPCWRPPVPQHGINS